jgi:hypothetical protein
MTTTPLAEKKKTVAAKPAAGEPCPHCGSVEPWGSMSWCPACGFYPALGGTSLRSAEEVGADTGDREAWETRDDGPANLFDMIPAWGWMAMGGTVLILLANIGARVMLPLKDSHRALLTLLEFSVGFILAAVSHLQAYLFAACKSDKFGPFDFFMKPIEIWKPTVKKLPEGSKRVCGMAWGTTAIFAALLIMAGFAFDSIFDDWGFEKHEAPSLVKEVVKKARKKGNGNEDLEGAIKEFVGEGELEDADAVLLETRCVIIGYTRTDMGQLDSVVLSSAPRGRLAYVGLLSQADVPEESRQDLLNELEALKQLKTCYIKQDVPLKSAIWVEPKVLCLIEHKSWTTQYRLQQPKFLKLVNPEEEKDKEKEKTTDSGPGK